MGSKKDKRKNRKKKSMAAKADKFLCYQKSVQSPEHEIEFFEQAYRDVFKRKPYSLREDFCGTFAICCDWAKSDNKRTSLGVDFCAETLQWGRENNLSKLAEVEQGRVRLLEQDVRKRNRLKSTFLPRKIFRFGSLRLAPKSSRTSRPPAPTSSQTGSWSWT